MNKSGEPVLDEDGFYSWDDKEMEADGKPEAGGDGDLDVEIVDDRPEEDRVAPRDPARAADASDFADESKDDEADEVLQSRRIKRLRYEWHEERRAKEAADRQREEAIRFAQAIRDENQRLKSLLKNGEKVLVDEVRARTKSDLDQARAQLKRAVEDGDAEKIASAQEALARATYDLRQAESYQYQETGPDETPPQNAGQNQAPQPVQRQAAPVQDDPKLKSWMDKNPWFMRDENMTTYALAVHKKLVEIDGVSPKGDEYYRKIDLEMRRAYPTRFYQDQDGDERSPQGDKGKAEPARKKSSQVVAPAGRTSGGSPKRVQLTASQAQIARRMGLTPKQYAIEMMRIQESERNG